MWVEQQRRREYRIEMSGFEQQKRGTRLRRKVNCFSRSGEITST
jgi:IS1 family transposase